MKPISECPEELAECPECNGGLISLVEFGSGETKEVHAFCGGINNEKDEGCGWAEIYSANVQEHL